MVDGGGLENRCARKGTGGSNPSSSAIRKATLADVAALSALASRTFVTTFVDELKIPYPPADLEVHLHKSYGLDATRALIEDPALYVAVIDAPGSKALAAYVLAGACHLPHPDATPTQGELRRLYVAHEHHGKGYGAALMKGAFAWIDQHFTGPHWLGVWSGNLKAQAVYQHYGFSKVGEYDYPVGGWMDREHIYRRG